MPKSSIRVHSLSTFKPCIVPVSGDTLLTQARLQETQRMFASRQQDAPQTFGVWTRPDAHDQTPFTESDSSNALWFIIGSAKAKEVNRYRQIWNHVS